MHRYWAAAYPADSSPTSTWTANGWKTYRDETPSVGRVVATERMLSSAPVRVRGRPPRVRKSGPRVKHGTGRNSQAESLETAVYLLDLATFMPTSRDARRSWRPQPAMLPQTNVTVSDALAATFERQAVGVANWSTSRMTIDAATAGLLPPWASEHARATDAREIQRGAPHARCIRCEGRRDRGPLRHHRLTAVRKVSSSSHDPQRHASPAASEVSAKRRLAVRRSPRWRPQPALLNASGRGIHGNPQQSLACRILSADGTIEYAGVRSCCAPAAVQYRVEQPIEAHLVVGAGAHVLDNEIVGLDPAGHGDTVLDRGGSAT